MYRHIFGMDVRFVWLVCSAAMVCGQIPPGPPEAFPRQDPASFPNDNIPNQPFLTNPFGEPVLPNQPLVPPNQFSPPNQPFDPGAPLPPGLPWDRPFEANPYESNIIINEATYFIVASKVVRPGQLYRVAVTVLQASKSIMVRGNIQRNGVEVSADHKEVKPGIPEVLLMKMPPTSVPGNYRLRVEGIAEGVFGGSTFLNETDLVFSKRSLTIFIQTDKPVYMQSQLVRFRTIPISTELRAFQDSVDVYLLDPNRHIMRRWLSRQSNLGTVSLSYQLSDQPVFGEWTIQVTAQGQIEEGKFVVEEYYQTRFEVNVTMPAFFFNTEPFIHGTVQANYTSGGPVRGNLTLRATVFPLRQPLARPIEKYFTFEESYPFWLPKRIFSFIDDPYNTFVNDRSTQNYYGYSSRQPYLAFFNGVYHFKFPMAELAKSVPNLNEVEVRVTATVGDHFLDEIIEGYSTARIYNSSVKLSVLGGSPQVFKPSMPFQLFFAASFHDNAPLPNHRLLNSRVQVTGTVQMLTGGSRTLEFRLPEKSDKSEGVWELPVNLRSQLGLEDNVNGKNVLNEIASMRVQAVFIDSFGGNARAEVLLLTHYSPYNRQIKISTSTKHPKVGEYLVLHVQTNFHLETFNYIVMSKGMILLTGQENMQATVRTFSVPLSVEMAPTATVVCYHVGRYGDVSVDSLTFPVNGISRNNFTILINNKKARTGERVEVAIYGEPGAYVGLSGIDKSFFSMQAGNELSYAQVITRMASFGEETNGTFMQSWSSHEGDPDENVYFPSSTFGIDANRTFEYSGLVVFSDIIVPRRPGFCNATLGFLECLIGGCFHVQARCDGRFDCQDGTDESGCPTFNATDLKRFRLQRFNRIQRQYENVWMWHDINIGPHGRFIFDIPVPKRPAHWMVSAFSMGPKLGFGMVQKAIEYVGVLPFFINVEMPTESRQGEQVGIRVTVFNYMKSDMEATVVLHSSSDYKFVHVEMNGYVRSYNPRTSFGEHQFFIYIPTQDASVVFLPIVPTRLGDISITVSAFTLIGKDTVTRTLHVEADGLPQYRHISTLLDLSNRAYLAQYLHVNITETPIIPYDEDRYYVFGSNKAQVTIVGDVVGPLFPTMPVNATSLLHLPMDCGEQNMFSFAANLYTTLYMRYANQRNRTTERNSFFHMNVGYQRQLSFMHPDGSFSSFRTDWNQSSPSVWLTAFCARVFQEASFYEWENYLYIDPQVISKAVAWVLRHQTEDGSFYEVTWVPDRKANSTLRWPNDPVRSRNITLTAHVLIMLDTVKDLTGGLGSLVSLAQSKAMKWLERNLKLVSEWGEPYDVALIAYALQLSKSSSAETAFSILARHARSEGGLTYWGKEAIPPPPTKMENQRPFLLPRLPYKNDATNIETTAYALLVYTARQELLTDSIVMWLNSQRLTDGGWASTQDTATAMKGLIEYTNRNRLRDVSSLQVIVEASALYGRSKILYINDKNRAQLQTLDIPQAWGSVKVQAKGAGFAILQMTVQYNVDIPKFQTQPPIRSFALNTRAHFFGRNQSHISYHCCQRWTHVAESARSGMAVLDVTIPTGYIIQQQDLDAYIRSRYVPGLQRARYHERKVLFYFDYLDNFDTCVDFTVERWFPVANMSRYLPIRVYDYYAPERFNETIFDAVPTYLLNICEVCGSSQCPYCPIYNLSSLTSVSGYVIIFTSVFLLFRNYVISLPTT